MIILGAGMSGCLMGAINGNSKIYEAQKEIPNNHKAVLRFREDKISKVTGIPFRKVKVIKGIWYGGEERSLSPRFVNLYSKKVSNKYLSRSITNLDTVERFIAPSDFQEILADMCGNRIKFNHKVNEITREGIDFINDENGKFILTANKPVISTMPMKVLSEITGIDIDVKFQFKSIKVTRYKVDNADIFQTIYYPGEYTPIYRATMTGDDLIIESIYNESDFAKDQLDEVVNSFGFKLYDLEIVSETKQKYGKIAPINDHARKHFMFKATTELGVYSLGRYACWKNILLDDVYDDIFKIKQMIEQDHYALKKEML